MLKLRKFWYNMGSYEKPYPLPEPEAPRPLERGAGIQIIHILLVRYP